MSIPNRGLNVLKYNEERLNSAKFLALAKKRSHEERDVVEIDDKQVQDICESYKWQEEELYCRVKKDQKVLHLKYQSRVDWAKITLVQNEIYVIGGKHQDMLQASNQCLKVNLKTGVVIKRRSMDVTRMGHATCLVGHYIYVTGGLKDLSEVDLGQKNPTPIETNARYNILKNTWEEIAPLIGGAAKSSSTLIAVGKWLYQIAGNFGDSNVWRLNLSKPFDFDAWEKVDAQISCDNKLLSCGQVGILNLNDRDKSYRSEAPENNTTKLLLFGGIDNEEKEQKEVAVLTLGTDGCVYERMADLSQPDRFFSNQAVCLDKSGLDNTRVGFTGRN